MNNAVSYAMDSQVIFQMFFSIVCIAAAIGVSILVLRFMRKFIDFCYNRGNRSKEGILGPFL